MFFRATCLAVFTSLTIAADSGHLPAQLLKNAEQAEKPAPLLWVAVQQNNLQAKQRLLEHADTNRNQYWLEMLIKSGYSPAALALSRLGCACDNPCAGDQVRLRGARREGRGAEGRLRACAEPEALSALRAWVRLRAEAGKLCYVKGYPRT